MRTLLLAAVLCISACPAHVRREVCDRYVACALAADATPAQQVVATYGPDSACWTSDKEGRACVEGCEAGLASLKSNGVLCPEVNDAR